MRYISNLLDSLSSDKFVIISGPRQVGKTTVAKDWLGSTGRYLSYDAPKDRAYFLKNLLASSLPEARYVFDELHKYRRWKNWLKSVFDAQGDNIQVVVTGSARVEVFRKGADSMFGRYELLRLHPLSIGELTHGVLREPPGDWLNVLEPKASESNWARLMQRSGFPEPYYADDTRQYKRWVQRRRELIINQDLRDISDIREISGIEHLSLLLPERVGSPLSLNSLREDLLVAHDTVKNWVGYLDLLYYTFRIRPYTGKLRQSLRREEKLYLWDWAEIEDEGSRFENMVASHLLKSVHAWSDAGFDEFDLLYWRDKQKREVDFVVCRRRKPIVLIECKLHDTAPSESLRYLGERLNIPHIQLVNVPSIDMRRGLFRTVSAAPFLAALV